MANWMNPRWYVAKIAHYVGKNIFESQFSSVKLIGTSSTPDIVPKQDSFNGFPLKIIHLSDLHFGRHHPDKLAHLERFLTRTAPHLVLISGDIVDEPIESHFTAAQQFFTFLNGKNFATFIAPGNHDRHGEIDLNTWMSKFKIHRGPYDCKLIRLSSELTVTLLILNSTIAKQNDYYHQIVEDALQVRGWIDEEQLEWLDNVYGTLIKCHKAEFLRSLKIAVLHHHPLPTRHSNPREQFMFLGNAGALLDKLVKFGVNFILHGHQHDPTIQVLSREDTFGDIIVLGAGTALRASEGEEELKPDLSKDTSIYLIEVGTNEYKVTQHNYANNLQLENKFVPTKTIYRSRRHSKFEICEVAVKWKIKLPETDFSLSEVQTLRMPSGNSEVEDYTFTIVGASPPNHTPPSFNDLKFEAKRLFDDQVVPLPVRSSPLPKTREGVGGEIVFEYKVNLECNPPRATGLHTDTLTYSYSWAGGFWEFSTLDTVEGDFDYPFHIDKFTFIVEFVAPQTIRKFLVLPQDFSGEDQGVYADIGSGFARVDSQIEVTNANAWMYIKRDIAAHTRITYSISR